MLSTGSHDGYEIVSNLTKKIYGTMASRLTWFGCYTDDRVEHYRWTKNNERQDEWEVLIPLHHSIIGDSDIGDDLVSCNIYMTIHYDCEEKEL